MALLLFGEGCKGCGRVHNGDEGQYGLQRAQEDPYIKSAYEQLQVVSQDKEKRLEYEARQKAIWDYNQMMLEAEKHGRRQGEELAKERINKLNVFLIKEKRFQDMERSTPDKDYQRQLMEQYGI